MSEAPKKNPDFQLVEPAQTILLLKEGCKTLSSALFWTKDQKQVLSTHLILFSDVDQILYVWSPKDFDDKRFLAELREGVNEVFFSVSLPTANIFFQTSIQGVDPAGMRFDVPKKVYKVQRRNHLRFPIPDGKIIKVDFIDPLLEDQKLSDRKATRKIHDISAGGLAFITPIEEDIIYKKGVKLRNITFTINQRTVMADGEIKHTSALPKNSRHQGLKVGVEFTNIKPADSQFIAVFVFDESRKYFSKFI